MAAAWCCGQGVLRYVGVAGWRAGGGPEWGARAGMRGGVIWVLGVGELVLQDDGGAVGVGEVRWVLLAGQGGRTEAMASVARRDRGIGVFSGI